MIQLVNMMSPTNPNGRRNFNVLPIIGITWWSDNGWSLYFMWLHICLRIGPKVQW